MSHSKHWPKKIAEQFIKYGTFNAADWTVQVYTSAIDKQANWNHIEHSLYLKVWICMKYPLLMINLK